jgi:allophanate hydrolase
MTAIDTSIAGLSQAYRDGSLDPRKVLHGLRKQALAQTDYNAWIHVLSEKELDRFLDQLAGKSPATHPLYGIPFAVKDNIDVAGIPTTAACPDFTYMPGSHAPAVALLMDAGAIPLGKTNLDQFATGLVGTRSPFGQGKNVFNKDYISGGSSAGSAIATALGQVSFALGTDTAGSGRVPAVLNNLVGHKPTKGLVSTRGVVPACRTQDCVSIFSLTALDAARVFEVLAHHDAEDAFARKNPHHNRLRYFTGAGPAAFRFGVIDASALTPELATLYRKGVDTLTSVGGTAVTLDAEPFLETARLLYQGPWVAERWLATRKLNPEYMLPVIREIVSTATQSSAADAFAAQYRLAELKQRCDAQMASVDFAVMPTTPAIYTRAEIDADPLALNSKLGTYTNFVNLLDYCATAVPVGVVAAGPYWGLTLFAPAFRDIYLLNLAYALQTALALPMGATSQPFKAEAVAGLPMPGQRVEVVVCGAHLQGQPLNWQLTERGGLLVKRCESAACYRLYALSDGKRPAMIRSAEGGQAIEVEVWSVPAEHFGSFVAAIPAPLGIGKVELDDGSWKSGFICESSGLAGATEITHLRAWRKWLAR